MNAMLASTAEIVIVVCVVAAAVVGVGWSLLRSLRGKGGCACGASKDACPAKSNCHRRP